MATTPKRVLIIGGGPSGLVTSKTLLHFPPHLAGLPPHSLAFDPVILEGTDRIGGTFAHRGYENGTLVSSKQLTCFSDYRMPLDSPDHISLPDYVKYLERYIVMFGLDSATGKAWEGTDFQSTSRIQLRTKVLRMDRQGAQHKVTFIREGESGPQSVIVDAVSISTGLHVLPAVPTIPGLEHLQPQNPPITIPPYSDQPTKAPGLEHLQLPEGVRVIHSSQYRRRDEFTGRKVLILGCGETSMDLSYEAIQAEAQDVTVCHRGGFLSFPKVLNDFQVFGVTFSGNLPIDGLITNLFETAYVHPWVAASHIRWFVSDFVIKRVLWLLTGTMAGCNQHAGALPPQRLGRAYVFLNKSTKAIPYINKPFPPSKLATFFRSLLGTRYINPPDPYPDAFISLAPWPTSISPNGEVVFPTNIDTPEGRRMADPKTPRIRPDLVVLATGYRQSWDWLGEGYPRGPEDIKVDVREVCSSQDTSVSFVGFVRPGVGAIPPIAEMQAQLWALLLAGAVKTPTSEPTYRLLASDTARIQYGVDHSTYMSTLAKDMGCAPDLITLWWTTGFHVLLAYCFGAAFPSFYRLNGPYHSSKMVDIVKTELWETITRRGFLGNVFMGVIPMLFYALINLIAFIVEAIWVVGGKPEPPRWLAEQLAIVGPKQKVGIGRRAKVGEVVKVRKD